MVCILFWLKNIHNNTKKTGENPVALVYIFSKNYIAFLKALFMKTFNISFWESQETRQYNLVILFVILSIPSKKTFVPVASLNL